MENPVNGWYLPHHVKFFILLILQIPAIILCLFIFTFFILHQTVLRKLQHKALLIIFIINFIQLTFNVPLSIHFFHLSRVSPATITYCKWWIFVECTLDAINEFLVTTIAIQRHIHIFQANVLNVSRTRYFIYYLPLIICVIYPIIFYMGAVAFYPCDDTQWDFTSNKCGDTTCFLSNNKILAAFDWIMNTGLPMVVLTLANITLITRFIRQKYRRQQVINWSKQRRMTLQLVGISSLYLIAWLPSIIVGLIQQLKPTEFLQKIEEDYISDLTYLICLCLPWISIGLVPEFKQWMLKQFHRIKRQTNMVRPTQ